MSCCEIRMSLLGGIRSTDRDTIDPSGGARQVDDSWFEEKLLIHGSYGSNYNADYYGFGHQSFEDF